MASDLKRQKVTHTQMSLNYDVKGVSTFIIRHKYKRVNINC